MSRMAKEGAAPASVRQACAVVPPAAAAVAAAVHTDANALTNLAFWSTHPDLFGTKLQPSQPGFSALAADWMQIHDTVVRCPNPRAETGVAERPPPAQPPSRRPGSRLRVRSRRRRRGRKQGWQRLQSRH